MATISRDNGSEWRASGIIRRDFRSMRDGPEVSRRTSNGKKKGKKWCRGKEGRTHRFAHVPERSFGMLGRRWEVFRCLVCGREEWNLHNKYPGMYPLHTKR